MLALRVDYLTGRATATAYNNRESAEWPPHPARLFSALVSAWADADAPDDERDALHWLQSQPAPRIACSAASPRTVVKHFVPVNDPTLTSAALSRYRDAADAAGDASAVAEGSNDALAARKRATQREKAERKYAAELAKVIAPAAPSQDALRTAASLLPEGRERQPRHFPSVTPDDPVVHFIWPQPPSPPAREALARLCARMVCLGHSSSLVHARVVDAAPAATWAPDADGPVVLRIPGDGQLQRLQDDFTRHRGVEPRVMPFTAARYARSTGIDAPEIAAGPFQSSDWIVLRRVGAPVVAATAGVAAARALRAALMRHADQPVAQLLSGHEADGAPARALHLAVVPLPHVGERHADGRLMGIALVFPRAANVDERRAVIRAISRWESAARSETGDDAETPVLTLGFGRGIEMKFERVAWGEPDRASLRDTTWCRPAKEWVSVTPVALDRNPGRLDSRDAAVAGRARMAACATIEAACERAGLPAPEAIAVGAAPHIAGSRPASAYGPFPAGEGRTRRVLVHVRLRFPMPVVGPLLLGAGRFHGLGLMRPVREGDA